MLLSFSVSNFLSFKDEVQITFEASNEKDKPDNYNRISKQTILKSLAVYGPNASGKSNILIAIKFAVGFILNCTSSKATSKIKVTPFLLNTATENSPTRFEFEFLLKKKIYRYRFVVSSEAVINESLDILNTEDDTYDNLFIRKNSHITLNSQFGDDELVDKTRKNVLYLSVLAQWNSKIAMDIVGWFDNFSFARGNGPQPFRVSPEFTDLLSTHLIDAIKAADFGIESIKNEESVDREEDFPEGFPHELKNLLLSGEIKRVPEIKTYHSKYDENNKPVGTVEFTLDKEESDGTAKFISLLPDLLPVLAKGGVFVVDELENNLHTLLTRFIIEIFHNKEINSKGAQLLLTTHDASLLSSNLFRLDQLWVVSKDKYGVSDLYSLSDFDDVDKIKMNELSNYYLNGKFGGIPLLQKNKFLKIN